MKKFFSRFRFNYPRSLIYMLQASEYRVRDYFSWLGAAQDFSRVERRKKFVPTLKAVLLLACAWLIWAAIIGLAAGCILLLRAPANWILAAALVIFSPDLLACLVLIPLAALRIAQLPVELAILRCARKKLAVSKALKIAVAGSYGKTTMREILRAVLGAKKAAAPSASINTPLGISAFANSLKGDEEILIFEFGEYYPGDIKKLCRMVRPAIGIITGANEAHLEKFKTLERAAGTIFELAQFVAPRDLYINGENLAATGRAASGNILYSREGVHGAQGSCGTKNSAEWRVENASSDLSGTKFSIINCGTANFKTAENAAENKTGANTAENKTAENAAENKTGAIRLDLHSPLLGMHQIGPLALGVAIASRLGIPPEKIKAGIAQTRPFEHRLEPRSDSQGVIILDDSYNGNPDGAAAVIDFLASLKGANQGADSNGQKSLKRAGRRFYVTPGLVEMGARAEAVHKEIGRLLARAGIEKIVLIRDSVTPYIERGLRENDYKGEIIWFDDALAALAALPSMTAPGDVVLIQNDWPDQYR